MLSSNEKSSEKNSEKSNTDLHILVFSKTQGFRHESIADGNRMLQSLGSENHWTMTFSENADHFNGNLDQYDVVVFNNTLGDIFTPQQRSQFRSWLENGGGFLGIHSAVDTESKWAWYHDTVLAGARFIGHPDGEQVADLIIEEGKYGFLSHVGQPSERWRFFDEWYFWDVDLRQAPNVEVIARLDRTSYPTSVQPADSDHPVIFTNRVKEGRVYYTNQGHRGDTFRDSAFIEQIRKAVLWLHRGSE
ncbi:ThuA domain-containing protein [Marinibactrum halimedae]|uniref:ThuA-like domain-containing protein n=1 Tax=Marinibactrum halimedae TaxID=1444977 RepID=A0AA37T9M2_9GAMM|nr:ThuA domain-containing protein [Marinibactrum halimedae]MCD9460863.1 ThuA domain-containing protein [Marinibactrum halimedae]GLS27358.1 hypothetical protein GCM10007877_30770 [Marinibactrum halimedae]